jgi:hypothetical protein
MYTSAKEEELERRKLPGQNERSQNRPDDSGKDVVRAEQV